jgi:nitrous oxidase accessory protein NosD
MVTYFAAQDIQPYWGAQINSPRVRVANNEFNCWARSHGLKVGANYATIVNNTFAGPSKEGVLGLSVTAQNYSITGNTVWPYAYGIEAGGSLRAGEPEGSRGRVIKNKVMYSTEAGPLQTRGETGIEDVGAGHQINGNHIANYKIGINSVTDSGDPKISDNTFDSVAKEVMLERI